MVPILKQPVTGPWRGMLRRRRRTDHDAAYLHEAHNAELYGNAIAPRLGTKRLTTIPLGTTGNRRIAGMFQNKWRPGSGVDDVLVAAGPAIQQLFPTQSADLFDLAKLPAGTFARQPARSRVRFTQLNNATFICDGTNGLNLRYYYRDAAPRLEQWGLDAPTTAPGIALMAGGPLRGRRGYRQTFVNAVTQDESEPGSQSFADLDDVNGQATLTAGVALDPQVDRVRIYGTTLDGGGIWLFVAECAPGATVVDNFLDVELGILMEEFVNDPPPPTLRLAVSWPQAGVVLAVAEDSPSTVRYTDLLLGQMKPASFPPFNIIPIALDTGDEIMGLYPYADSVLVVCRRSMWRLTGQPPVVSVQPVQFDPRRTAIGGFAQEALVQVDDTIVNPFLDGAYLIGRYFDLQGGFTTTRLSRPIDDFWAELNVGAIRNAHAVFHRQTKQVCLFIPHGTGFDATRCLVFQLDVAAEETQHGGWTWHDYRNRDGQVRAISASLVIESAQGDRLLLGCDDGHVLETNQGMQDDWDGVSPGNGVSYPFVIEPVPVRLLPEEGEGIETRVRFLDMIVRPATAVANLAVTPITDFAHPWDATVLTFAAPAGFQLGTSHLGRDRLVGAPPTERTRLALLVRGEYHSFRIDTQIFNTRFFLERWTWFFQPLPLKARPPGVAQTQREFYLDGEPGGFGTGPFGGGGFGGG